MGTVGWAGVSEDKADGRVLRHIFVLFDDGGCVCCDGLTLIANWPAEHPSVASVENNQALGYNGTYGTSEPSGKPDGTTQCRIPREDVGQAGVCKADARVGQARWASEGKRE